MVFSTLIFLTAIVSAVADFKKACEGKSAGDFCEYQSDQGTCCDMMKNEAGNMEKFCRACKKPGAMTKSECSIHSRQGYLGCFSKREDAAVFQVCIGQNKGSDCMYETASSSRGGKTTPAYNTTGHCIAHYDHQGIMCLEAVGDEDDDECNGKGVGQPCTHSESPNAVCAHHSRRGNWMCLAPKEEAMVFVVCQGKEKGTSCAYSSSGGHGSDEGLIKGQCHAHDETLAGSKGGHGGMMCVQPSDLAPTEAPPTTSATPSTINTADGAKASVASQALVGMILLNSFM